MIDIRIACRKHPKYMGFRPPTAKWYRGDKGGQVCPGCKMVYNARHKTFFDNHGIATPWVRIWILPR